MMEFHFNKAEAELIKRALEDRRYTNSEEKVTASVIILSINDQIRFEPGPAVARPGW